MLLVRNGVHWFSRVSRPEFLGAVEEFRQEHGEIRRITDEVADAVSPLHRSGFDRSPSSYHGIRMIAEDRSRYAVRPFENAQAQLLLEVYPQHAMKRLGGSGGKPRGPAIFGRLAALSQLPLDVGPRFLRDCRERRGALEAALAARAAAIAVLTGEVDKSPDELAPERGDTVRREGWIYGIEGIIDGP